MTEISKRFAYPVVRKGDVVENYHGTEVADPYRWLEDADSPETQAWVEAQNKFTNEYLQKLPGREQIKARLTELFDYPKFSVPDRKADRYFFTKNDGLQNQAVLYYQDSLDGEPQLLLDPNKLSDDGTVALMAASITDDAKLMAYAVSASGSDWREIRVREIESGQEHSDVIQWSKFSTLPWLPDNSGFFYSRFPEPGSVPDEDQSNYNRVYLHKLGTAQADDQLIYERPDDKELMFSPIVTDDGKYLILTVSRGTDPTDRVYYRELNSNDEFIRLLDENDARYDFISNIGTTFYFQTNQNAPRGRVVAIDINNPARENWQEIIPEQAGVLAFTLMVNNQLVTAYMIDVHHELKLYKLDGTFDREITLPTIGSIIGLTGKREDSEMFIALDSYISPTTILQYDFKSGELNTFRKVETAFNSDDYETKQVFYNSKDGTRVSMFLTHKKGLQLDGNNPTWLYGYGGFDISLLPMFYVGKLLWLESGGIFAVANLRGGSEYGEEWHEAGMLERKQNVFDDFIGAAEWLIANNYTRKEKLTIEGRSNGGLLVAACMTQRPDLYGAVICGVPVIDMLRYHKFTVGRFWTGEYGNAELNADHFKFMYAYSPLHNVKKGICYPPTIIVTADHDDRVVPAHAFKFASTLQAADCGTNPILVRVETKAGHGMGKPTAKVIEELVDIYSFLFDTLEVKK